MSSGPIVQAVSIGRVVEASIARPDKSDGPVGRSEGWIQGFRPSALALLAVGVAMLRLLFAADRRVFHMFPDEAGQLAMARLFGGGTPWNLFEHSTWQPGYAILLSPVYLLTNDPLTVFRVGLALNALIAGITAVLLAVVARRLTMLSSGACLFVAAIVSLIPASLSSSAHVWAEPLVSLCFLATLVSFWRYAEVGRSIDGLAAIAVVVAGYTAHGRFLPTTVVVGVAVVLMELRRRGWRRAASAAAVLAAAMAASVAAAVAARSALWEDPGRTNTVSGTLRRINDPVALIDTVVGQTWYLLVTTAGVASLGLLALVRSAIGLESATDDNHPGAERSRRIGSVVLLLLLVPQLALSVLFTSGRGRIDQVVYGRYNDAVVMPLLVVGVAWLVGVARSSHQRSGFAAVGITAAATLGTSTYLWLRFGSSIDGEGSVREMVPGLVPFYGRGDIGGITAPMLLSLLVLLSLYLVTLMPRRADGWFAALLTVFVAVAAVSTHHGLTVNLNSFESAKQVEDVREFIPQGEVVGFRLVPPTEVSYVLTIHQHFAAQLYQMYLPEYEFVSDEGPYDDVGPYVFAPRLDPALVDAGAVALWEASDTGMTLWRERR